MLDWLKNILSAKRPVPDSLRAPASSEPDPRLRQSVSLKQHGDALLDQSDWQGAADQYRQAIALVPQFAEAHGNLSLALLHLGQFDAARHHGQKAVSIKPELFNSHYLLAMISRQLGDLPAAEASLRYAIAVKPNFAEAYHELATLHVSRGDRARAFAIFRRVLVLDPNSVPTLFHVAALLESQGSRLEAIDFYRRALALDPDLHSARLSLLHQQMQICDWRELEIDLEAARRAVREAEVDVNQCDSPFAFLTLPGATAEEQKRCAEKWVQVQYRRQYAIRDSLGLSFARERNSKPHIAYLSADFCDHATARLMAQVFELHDRDRYRVSAYSYSPIDNSSMSARMRAAFDSFIDISDQSDIDAAKRIYQDRVDILVDLKGYTGDTRSAILALRPAPIQVNYLGYPGTMGGDFIDYLIADRFVIPESERKYYTETVVYLPHTYQPNDRIRARGPNPGRQAVGLPETGLVFCCFNQTYKITPDMFVIWCELLNQVPDSVLWLIASDAHTQGNLRHEASQRDVDPQRLLFAPRVSSDAHLARHQCADLFLDTIPYNAHTTCSDALWMGVPVITVAGDTFPARVAGSLLTALGLPELITESREAYFTLALQLAQDGARRAAIREKIAANRDTAPLFDSHLFTRDLECAYQGMLDRQA